jgi:hypothetical protein
MPGAGLTAPRPAGGVRVRVHLRVASAADLATGKGCGEAVPCDRRGLSGIGVGSLRRAPPRSAYPSRRVAGPGLAACPQLVTATPC